MASAVYRIRIRGHLRPEWSDWFDDMMIHHEGPDTTLTGPVVDQPVLYGLLLKLRDLGLTLLSVEQVEPWRNWKSEICQNLSAVSAITFLIASDMRECLKWG